MIKITSTIQSRKDDGANARLRFSRYAIITGILVVCGFLNAQNSAAATYYVSSSGGNSNTCAQAQNITTPKQTINGGIGCLTAPGDILYVRSGTYTATTSVQALKGTSASRITIARYPSDPAGSVIIRPPNPAPDIAMWVINSQYVTISGIVMDCYNLAYSTCLVVGDANGNIRFVDIEVKNTGRIRGGFYTSDVPDNTNGISGGGSNLEFINCSVHDNGNGHFDHGFYMTSNTVLIDGCRIYSNAGWGIQKSPSGDNYTIRNNKVYDNGRSKGAGDPSGAGPGIYLSGGSGSVIYNNVVYENNSQGISVESSESGTGIYNNTVYGNGAGNGYGGIYAPGSGLTVKNNIAYNNVGAAITLGSATQSNNLVGGTDPLFVNPTARDFHLQPTSPAIDKGTTLSMFATDLESTPRSGAYDIGAYEYVTTQTVAAPKNLRNLP